MVRPLTVPSIDTAVRIASYRSPAALHRRLKQVASRRLDDRFLHGFPRRIFGLFRLLGLLDLGDRRAFRLLHGLAVLGELFQFRLELAPCGDLLEQFYQRRARAMPQVLRCLASPDRSLPLEPPVLRFATGKAWKPQGEFRFYPPLGFANQQSHSCNAASQFAPQSQPPMRAGPNQK
jgi:hypothetical protein